MTGKPTYEDLEQRIRALEEESIKGKHAEEALQKSEERYRALVENAGDLIYRMDAAGRIVYVNPAGLRASGYAGEELIGRHYLELVRPDKRDEAGKFFGRQFVKKIKSLYSEFPILTKDGHEICLAQNTQLIVADGQVTGFQSISRDITDRRRAEETLLRSEEKYRKLAETAHDMIVTIDLDFKVTYVNKATLEYTGGIEPVGFNVLDYTPPSLRPFQEEMMKKRREGFSDVSAFEWQLNYHAGKTSTFDIRSTLLTENGKPAGVMFIIRDITARKQAEEALGESERRIKLALEGTDQGLWEWDILSRKVVFDENWQRMMNLPSEGRYVDMDKWLASMDAEGRAAFEMKMTDYLADRARYYELEHRLQTENKDWKWIWTRGIATERDPSGIPLRMIGTYRDITKHKQQEEVLRESEEKYRLIAESTADLISIMDMDLRFTYVSPATMRLRGFTVEEAMREPLDQVLTPESMRLAMAVYAEEMQLEADGTADPDRMRILELEEYKKDGSIIWVEVSLSFLRNGGGKPVGILMVSRDITARKRVEAEQRLLAETLRDSEAKFRSLVEYSLEGIMILDFQGTILFANDIVAQALEVEDRASLTGRNMMDFIAPESVEDVVRDFIDVAEGSGGYLAQYFTISNSGKKLCVECIGKLIMYEGQPADLVSIRDITDRKRAEEEKRILEERLNRAEKMEALGTLAGGVAHDLNNVLGIVVGYAQILLYGMDKSNPLRDGLTNIMQGGERAAAIVQDLLTLARRGVSTRQILNLNKVVVACRESPEFGKVCSYHAGVRIEIDLERDLLNVSGSPVHLGTTVLNLAKNACESMPKGGLLTIGTANRYLDKPVQGYDEVREGDYVVLSVSDTGEGIPAADLQRIFEPFYTKKVMGRSGTGLGLAVVWGTVKDHDGYIDVASEEGKGSTFNIYFPASREEIAAETVAVPISEYMGKGESILVVDDVEGQRKLAAHMLGKLNYRVETVAGGEEAVACLMDHSVDLMVLDMIMDPGMDGLDTYRSVLAVSPGQKAIIVSGFSETDRVRAAQALGAGAYVKKPYVLEKLGLAVRAELDKKMQKS